jgi:hypothetical protein
LQPSLAAPTRSGVARDAGLTRHQHHTAVLKQNSGNFREYLAEKPATRSVPLLVSPAAPAEPQGGPRVDLSAMARILIFGLLVLIASNPVNIDAIVAQWQSAYPSGPAQMTALHRCYTENHQFNRISAEARRGCYAKWLPQIEARQAPV